VKKLEFILLSFILVLALGLRLYKINRPIADWHSWRQADTAAVARNFIKEGFSPFIPKFEDMSTQANGLDNPNRYRFVEFPIYNTAIAAVWTRTGVNTLYARLMTVFITLGSTIVLYFLVRTFSGPKIAALSTFFFATIPYNVFYSSTILPGPLMVFGILALYFSFANWLKSEKWPWLISSAFFANLAILTWPIALFFLLPLAYLAINKFGLKAFRRLDLWFFSVLSFLPFALWRIWMMRFPEGIPNYLFLLNEGNIRFKGAFFRWIIAERLGKLILTVTGFFIFALGLIKKPEKAENWFYYSWLASCIFYVVVFASGNVRHDYYQVPLIPTLCVFMAIGVNFLFNLPNQIFNKAIGPAIAITSIILMFAFGYYEVRGYYWINKPKIIEAGQAADRLLPKDATVIAPYNGDAAFLYATNRNGYPIVDRPLTKFVENGTKYFVSVDPNDQGIQNLTKNCKVIKKTADYVILELSTQCLTK